MSEPAGIASWDRLSPDAQRSLMDLAEMYAQRVDAHVEITLAQGGTRDFQVKMKNSTLRALLKRPA